MAAAAATAAQLDMAHKTGCSCAGGVGGYGWGTGCYRDVDVGEHVVTQGEAQREVMLMLSGSVDVAVDGEVIARLDTRHGRRPFVGEAEFFSRQPNVATVSSHLPCWLVHRIDTASSTAARPKLPCQMHSSTTDRAYGTTGWSAPCGVCCRLPCRTGGGQGARHTLPGVAAGGPGPGERDDRPAEMTNKNAPLN